MKHTSKTTRAALQQGLCAGVLVWSAGCFEDPPPVMGETSGGTASESGAGSTSASSTGATADPSTSGSTSTSTSGEIGSAAVESGVDESSSGVEDLCGNDFLDLGEMCDGTPGCDAECRFTDYACNPLNDAECIAPLRCGLVDFASETFACMQTGPAGVGGECGESAANDGDCDGGLTCLFNSQTVLCDIGNCCVHYCDITQGDSGCADFELCAQFFPNPMFLGLEHLGFCFSE